MRRFAAAVLFFCGCGPASFTDFRDQLVARWCDRAVRCGLIGASERASCVLPAATPALMMSALDIQGSIDAGRVRWNSDSAQDCLDTLSGSTCDPGALDLRLALHCHGYVTALVPPRGACYGPGECGGGVCTLGASCPGSCQVYPAVGAPCTPGDCDPSVEYCGAPDGGTPKCALQKHSGDDCGGDGECSFGLLCIAAKCSAPTRTGRNQPCGAGLPICDDGLFCNAAGTCAPLQGSNQPCEPNGCAMGYVCLGGACQGWLDAGKSCAAGASPTGCPASQTCTAGACVANALLVGLHGNCANGGTCAAGLQCAKPRSTCEFPVGLGGGCTDSSACATGLGCACPPSTMTMSACSPDKQICVDPSGQACAP